MQQIDTIHQPVLLDQCVSLLTPALQRDNTIWVDCTLGLAGHALAVLRATNSTNARLIGIDRDGHALHKATSRIEQEAFASRFTPVHAPFDQFSEALDDLNIDRVNAVFLDLGLSSLQIDEVDRGFTYANDGPLDMRMDDHQTFSAQSVLATYSEEELISIFHVYGQEKYAGRIARAIVAQRSETPFTTSRQLVDLVDRVVPKAGRPAGNPAKRVFQALRIEVNGELECLASVLPQAVSRLSVGGRLVVESYHSLEDRMVKQFMTAGAHIEMPHGMPLLTDQAQPWFKLLTRGAIKADEEEIARNTRSKSVRLRGIEMRKPIALSQAQAFVQSLRVSATPQQSGNKSARNTSRKGTKKTVRNTTSRKSASHTTTRNNQKYGRR